MLKIVQVPHKVLMSSTIPVKKIDKKIKELVYEMEETLISQIDPQGVGLAAPQVGLNLSLFIMKTSPKAQTEVCINPKILQIEQKIPQKDEKEENNKLEGCLSIPHIWGPLKRPSKILLQYQDLTGETLIRWFTGFKATVIQHEVDHLQGVLFTQRSLEQKAPLYEEKNGELEKMKY